jgi:hypothetical protein
MHRHRQIKPLAIPTAIRQNNECFHSRYVRVVGHIGTP